MATILPDPAVAAVVVAEADIGAARVGAAASGAKHCRFLWLTFAN